MDEIVATLVGQVQSWSPLEIVAVAAAIAYLVLAIRQNIACWFFALLSTGIYIALFIEARLYMESVLNAFYFGMAVYGWVSWRHGGDNDLPVSQRSIGFHVVAIVAIMLVALVNGFLLDRYSDAAFPYVDSMTTWAAIWTTYLVAQKVLENWWYWLVIDVVSIFIYWNRGLELTALLFVLYVAMIPFGYLAWRKSLREQFV